MKHNYTPNMLVKLIYGETDIFETLELENSIENDSKLKSMYLSLKNGFRRFPKVKFSPQKRSIENILFYSSQSALSQPIG